ncbi:MAG: Na(+)/H(+) antiporter subunit B [Gammaproteobacteria bacterium]|nr:Na(+)/H(+) antiporter subunit B [Gammaproteobacteria bacterium]
MLAEVLVRRLYIVVLVASAWVLLRGHNAPGGGFIGGLLAVAATAAYALTFDATRALQRLPLGPLRLAALGVLVSLISGLPALLQNLPFLTHLWFTLPLGFTELPLSTVMLFDLGVYLCVWGALGGYCLALVRAIEPEP